MLRLSGCSALSPFRRERLLAGLPEVHGLHAEYQHFVALERELDGAELALLRQLLEYGPREAGSEARAAADAELGPCDVIVAPRLGTVSPWASKATEIARMCGLSAVRCIERGVLYRLHKPNGAALTDAERAALFDPMTQSTFASWQAVAELFAHTPPRPQRR